MLYEFISNRLANLGIPNAVEMPLIFGSGTTMFVDFRNIIALIITSVALITSLLIIGACILLPFKFIHKTMHKWSDKQ